MWKLADLRSALGEAGVRPRRSRGQNFMVDRNFLEFIVRTAQVCADDSVLEIGAGPGQLTERLAGSAKRVWAVEIDKRLAEICSEHVRAFQNVEVICADILDGRRALNRDLVDRIVAEGPGGVKVVSNLPYSIAATVLVNLLESGLPVSVITVLTQYEMAERLIAAPGTRQYGQLSIIVGALADVKVVRKVPPDLFWPRPAVQSALITIRPVRAEFARTKKYQDLKRAVHQLFKFRRKQLATALKASDYDARSVCSRSGIDPTWRCEMLDVPGFLRLAESMVE